MANLNQFFRKNYLILIIVGIFFILYSLVSLVPHYNFRTTAWDMGIYNQTLYHYANFQIKPNTIKGISNLLGDHFELILFLLAPFYWLFHTYTLLIFQILAIISGGLGAFLFLREKTKDEILALSGLVLFYLFFGVFIALGFCIHCNVIGIMFLPWLFYFLKKEKIKLYYVFLLLMLISREDMALIGAILGLTVIIFEKKSLKKQGLITFILSIIYFFSAIKFISLFNQGSYSYLSLYGTLGHAFFGGDKMKISNPFFIFSYFLNPEVKREALKFLLVSGGFLAIWRPQYLLLAIPMLCRNFFTDSPERWRADYGFHYWIEIAPIISIGSIIMIYRLKGAIGYSFLKYSLISVLIISNLFLLSQIHFFDGSKLSRIFIPIYYSGDFAQRNEIAEAIKKIPADASLSAYNTIVPHAANRDKIYLFPEINDSQYIILSLQNIQLNNDREVFQKEYSKWQEIEKNKEWQKIYNQRGVIVYKKML
ncbi:MAG: DUF2079 domain-containing protein [Patescibacteria group bacterium]